MKFLRRISPLKFAAAVAIALILADIAYSCNTSGCTDNQSALPLAGFYSSASGKGITVTGLTVRGQGAPNDSVLYGPVPGRSEAYLPFRSTADETTYLLSYEVDSVTTVTDRISFTYSSEPYFTSEECGAMYFYRIKTLSYTTNLIDSVTITDSLITNVNRERIHIYFRTDESQQQ